MEKGGRYQNNRGNRGGDRRFDDRGADRSGSRGGGFRGGRGGGGGGDRRGGGGGFGGGAAKCAFTQPGRDVNLYSNHFPVRFQQGNIAYLYNIDFQNAKSGFAKKHAFSSSKEFIEGVYGKVFRFRGMMLGF